MSESPSIDADASNTSISLQFSKSASFMESGVSENVLESKLKSASATSKDAASGLHCSSEFGSYQVLVLLVLGPRASHNDEYGSLLKDKGVNRVSSVKKSCHLTSSRLVNSSSK